MSELVAPALTKRQRYWLEQIQACEASGKTIAEYAMDHGIDVKAMYAGKKALVKKGVLPRTRATPFHKVQVVGPVMDSEWCIRLPNGVSITFYGTADAGTLATVLNAAAAVA